VVQPLAPAPVGLGRAGPRHRPRRAPPPASTTPSSPTCSPARCTTGPWAAASTSRPQGGRAHRRRRPGRPPGGPGRPASDTNR